jgi:hypothetical protein
MRILPLVIASALAAASCAPEKPDTSVPYVVDAAGSGNGVTADYVVTVGDSAGASDIIGVSYSDNGGASHACVLDNTPNDLGSDEENWDCNGVPDGDNDNITFLVENAGGFTGSD